MSSPFPASSYLRKSSAPSSDDGNDVPGMISTSSLQSFPESDNDSLSSSARSTRTRALSPAPASSPRSIFERYWSSPQHIKSLETDDDDDDDGNDDDAIMARLQTLRLPQTVDDKDSAAADEIVPAPVEHKKGFDDDSFDYQAALAPKTSGPTRTPRRQILPTPPPPTAVSSSLLRPQRRPDLLTLKPLDAGRKSRSASVLLGRQPHRSCLRGSRYSCPAIAVGSDATAGAGEVRRELAVAALGDGVRGELEKSVSFHARVSVLEFAVPREEEQRGQEGWSKIFA